jgi:cell division septation protein DedD
MSYDKNRSPRMGQIGVVSNPEDKPRRFGWLRSRGVVILGAVLMVGLLIVFGNISSRATPDGAEAASQSQNESLSVRAYQFTGQGELQGGSGETWIVGGVPVVVNSDTQIDGDLHPADSISLLGHITKNGKWVAERVVPIAEQDSFFSFAGPLEARDQNIWKVAGFPLLVNAQTQLGEAIPDHELVLATFKVLPDGTWLALQIEALSALEQSRTPTPTATPTATPTPTAKPTAPVQKPPAVKPAEQKPSKEKPPKEKPPKKKPPKKKPPKEKPVKQKLPISQSDTVNLFHNPGGNKGGYIISMELVALSDHPNHKDILGLCS